MTWYDKTRNGYNQPQYEFAGFPLWALAIWEPEDLDAVVIRAKAAGWHYWDRYDDHASERVILVMVPEVMHLPQAHYPDPASVRDTRLRMKGLQEIDELPRMLKKAAREKSIEVSDLPDGLIANPNTPAQVAEAYLRTQVLDDEDSQLIDLIGLYLRHLSRWQNVKDHSQNIMYEFVPVEIRSMTPQGCLAFVAEHWEMGDGAFDEWLRRNMLQNSTLVRLSVARALARSKKKPVWVKGTSENRSGAIVGTETYVEIEEGPDTGVCVLSMTSPSVRDRQIACGSAPKLKDRAEKIFEKWKHYDPPRIRPAHPFSRGFGMEVEVSDDAMPFALIQDNAFVDNDHVESFDDGKAMMERLFFNGYEHTISLSREGQHRVAVILSPGVSWYGVDLPSGPELLRLERIIHGHLNYSQAPTDLRKLAIGGWRQARPESEVASQHGTPAAQAEMHYPGVNVPTQFFRALSDYQHKNGKFADLTPRESALLIYNFWHLGDVRFRRWLKQKAKPTQAYFDHIAEAASSFGLPIAQTQPLSWHVDPVYVPHERREFAILTETVIAAVRTGEHSNIAVLWFKEGNDVVAAACGTPREMHQIVEQLYKDRHKWRNEPSPMVYLQQRRSA